MDNNKIENMALRIQLAAAAVASSLLFLAIPNVETISLVVFIMGFLFPAKFAVTTILTIVVSWELVITMFIGSSGITFPFKLLSWLIVGGLGIVSRKLGVKYYLEFLVLGAVSAIIYDLLTTSSIALTFYLLNQQQNFLSLFISSLIVGVYFTISHVIGNAIFFSFIPIILKNILPVLSQRYDRILSIDVDYFGYLKHIDISKKDYWSLGQIPNRRLISYLLILLVLISSLGTGIYYYSQPSTRGIENTTSNNTKMINITYQIDYDGLKSNEIYDLKVKNNATILGVLRSIADVNVTYKYGSNAFIQAINNIWNDKNLTNHYWVYFINGEFAQKAADVLSPQAGDNIKWSYQ